MKLHNELSQYMKIMYKVDAMTTERILSLEENCKMWLKAPEKASQWVFRCQTIVSQY